MKSGSIALSAPWTAFSLLQKPMFHAVELALLSEPITKRSQIDVPPYSALRLLLLELLLGRESSTNANALEVRDPKS